MKQNHHRINRIGQQAFTLVELLLVLTILGILAALVVPKMVGRSEQARLAAAKTDISTFSTALSVPRPIQKSRNILASPSPIFAPTP